MARTNLVNMLGMLRGPGTRAHLVRGAGGSIVVAGGARVLSLATSIILARALAPSGYGVYAFALALVGLLQVPAQFGLDQLLPREIAANEAIRRWDLTRGLLRRATQLVSLSTTAIAFVTLVVLWTAPLHLNRESLLTLSVAVGLMAVNAYATLASATLAGFRRVVIAQIPMQIGRPVVFLATVASIWLLAERRLDPVTAVAANMAATAIMLVILFFLVRSVLRRHAVPRTAWFETRRWLGSALPFSMMAGLGIINAQTDILMLGLITTSHDVGIYRVAVAGAGLVPMFLMAVNNAIGPTLAKLNSEGDRGKLALIARLTALSGLVTGLIVLVIFSVWGASLIRNVYGGAYLVAWTPLMVLSLGQAINAGMGPVGLVLNMTGYEKDALFGLGAAALVNIALNAGLIPLMGTMGAATATAVSTVVWNVLMASRVKRRLGFIPLGFVRPQV
ncbi:MAG TPA: flippase [Gammaproteobacteria bacterium]|nr:flippase [Gammaproteobacteria bacterium]